MSSTLKDGTGNSFFAKVDAKNRSHNGVVSRSERDAAIDAGRLFLISPQKITLTDDLITPIMYFKNNDDRELFLDVIVTTTSTSTGGTGSYELTSHVAVSETSTIVTEAKSMLAANAKISSPKLFNGDAFKGETGDTLVEGTNLANFIKLPGETFEFDPRAVIPKGVNVVLAVKPPAGNTSMDVSMIMAAYYLDTELPN